MATSTYLELLPPVLWEQDGALQQQQITLGELLSIFEKLLTGIDDGEPIVHGSHKHDSIKAEIDRLHELFDPWRTPAPEWLASWVALRFAPFWTDYQRRKITGEIVGIYGRRGVRDSLAEYLDLYTMAATRPRIAIDDSSRVLTTRLAAGRVARFTTLVSQGPSMHDRDYAAPASETLYHQGPVHPLCAAMAPNGDILLGDYGTPPNVGAVVGAAVWRVSAEGGYEWAGPPPQPAALQAQSSVTGVTWGTYRPVGLVVVPTGSSATSPWALYVLDQVPGFSMNALYKLTAPTPSSSAFTLTAVLTREQATPSSLKVRYPVAMALSAPGQLAVLDRGSTPGGAAGAPKIVRVDISGASPVVLAPWLFNNVFVEPLSIVALSNGDLVVGDARDQFIAAPAQLFRVDATTGAATALLSTSAAQNPLICPIALLRETDTSLLVADVGLKPFSPNAPLPMAKMAEPATVYRVTIPPAPFSATRATETGRLVFPTALVSDGTNLTVTDRGGWLPALAPRSAHDWRLWASDFGVLVRFSEQRPAGYVDRGRIVNEIYAILNRERPAHTNHTVVYRI